MLKSWHEHLVAMCDGKRHCFFDHVLARDLQRQGLIWGVPGTGAYVITDAGQQAVCASDSTRKTLVDRALTSID